MFVSRVSLTLPRIVADVSALVAGGYGRIFTKKRWDQIFHRSLIRPHLSQIKHAAASFIDRRCGHLFHKYFLSRQNQPIRRDYTTRVSAIHPAPWCVLIVDDDPEVRDVLSAMLVKAGHVVEQAGDGPEALDTLTTGEFDVVLLDVNLPSMNGLDVMAQIRGLQRPPLVVVMTGDDTPEPLLEAVRLQAYRYLRKPFPLRMVVDTINEAMLTAPRAGLPIQVISARPEWLEIIAPCALEMADRLQSFIMHLEGDLPEPVRESVAQAFRELLTNAIEWGGKLDPNRKVRISCVRARRVRIYRITDPGEGFAFEGAIGAAGIGDVFGRELVADPVGDSAGGDADEGVAFAAVLDARAADAVPAFVQHLPVADDVAAIVGFVRHDDHHGISRRGVDSLDDRTSEPVQSFVLDGPKFRVRGAELFENGPRLVGAAVIDHDYFMGNIVQTQFEVKMLDGRGDTPFFIPRGHDHAEQRQRR